MHVLVVAVDLEAEVVERMAARGCEVETVGDVECALHRLASATST